MVSGRVVGWTVATLLIVLVAMLWPAQFDAFVFVVVFGLALWVAFPGSQTLGVLHTVFITGGNPLALIRRALLIVGLLIGQAVVRVALFELSTVAILAAVLAVAGALAARVAWELRP